MLNMYSCTYREGWAMEICLIFDKKICSMSSVAASLAIIYAIMVVVSLVLSSGLSYAYSSLLLLLLLLAVARGGCQLAS